MPFQTKPRNSLPSKTPKAAEVEGHSQAPELANAFACSLVQLQGLSYFRELQFILKQYEFILYHPGAASPLIAMASPTMAWYNGIIAYLAKGD